MSHGQAIGIFKNIKQGVVSLHIARRQNHPFGKRRNKINLSEELEVAEEWHIDTEKTKEVTGELIDVDVEQILF